MTEIHIQGTDKTPKIVFDPDKGLIAFEGNSIPENAFKYYKSIIEGLAVFIADPTPKVNMVVKLIYINTASLNILVDLIKQFSIPVKEGKTQLLLDWYCDKEDVDMIECAKDTKNYFRKCEYDFNIHLV